MTWSIGLTPPPGARGYWIVDALNAQQAWKRLSKTAQAAVEAATKESILVYAHPLTIKALERHGFVVATAYSSRTAVLTDAGRAVAKWCVKP